MGIVSDLEKVNFLSYNICVLGGHVYDVVKSLYYTCWLYNHVSS